MEERKTFETVDYVIIGATQLLTLGIGLFFCLRANKTTSDYLIGDRKLPVLPVTLSLSVSLYSSVLVLGYPAENYSFGGTYLLYAIGVVLGAILACVTFVPVFHPLKLTSVNHYLLLRYKSTFVAILGTFSSVVLMILYTGVVYFGPATALHAITGFPIVYSILLCGGFTCIYTTIGGIKAVIWTDVFQAILMIISLLAVAIQAIILVGGIDEVWEICENGGRLKFNEFSADPTIRFTFWSLSIGTAFFDLNRYGIQQPAVQRFTSVSSLPKACLTILLTLPVVVCMMILTTLSGLSMFAFYDKMGCDPVRGKKISNANQLVPYFVLNDLGIPAFPGILFAGLISASLSTASSNINACGANIWDDVLRRVWPNASDKKALLATKALVFVFGVIATAVTFIVSSVGGTLVQMIITFMAACGGPTTSMFLLGIFLPFINWIGAAAGGFTGFTFALWMGFGAYSINNQRSFLPTTIANCTSFINVTTTTMSSVSITEGMQTITTTAINPLREFYSVSYLWIALFSLLLSMTVSIIVSILTNCMGLTKKEEPDPKLFHPLARKFIDFSKFEAESIEFVKGPKVDLNGGITDHDDNLKNGIKNPAMDQKECTRL